MRAALNSATSLALFTALAIGCGKEPNTSPRSFLHFSHTFPEAPRPLALDTSLRPGLNGSAIALREADLLIADRDNGVLTRLDRQTLQPLGSVSVGARPEQLVVTPSGDVWVTLRGTGELVRLDASLTERERHLVGVDAYGLAASPDGAVVWASLPFDGALVTLARDGERDAPYREVSRVLVGVLPRGLAWTPDLDPAGALIVANQEGAAHRVPLSTDYLPLPELTRRITLRDANPAEFKLANGDLMTTRFRNTFANRALAATYSPETGEAFIAHVVVAPGEPQTIATDFSVFDFDVPTADSHTPAPSSGGYGSSSRGGAVIGRDFSVPVRPMEPSVTVVVPGQHRSEPVEASLAVRDELTGEPLLHLVDQPIAIAHHPAMSLLFVVGYGTHNVLVLSTAEADPMRSPVALIDVGEAPRAIALSPDGREAFVLSDFDFTVTVVDLEPLLGMSTIAAREVLAPTPDPDDPMHRPSMSPPPSPPRLSTEMTLTPVTTDPTPDSPRVRPIRLAPARAARFGDDPWPAHLREGARLFTSPRDERISHAGQFACASCHFEGTEDAVKWVTPDGIRQTIALGDRLAGTAPFNWNGSEDALKTNMDKTISRLGGLGLSDAERDHLEAFLLDGLPKVRNPNLAPDGTLTAQQARGQEVFMDPQVGCAGCHRPETRFMDGLSHDVGTISQFEIARWEAARVVAPDLPRPGRLNTPSLRHLFYTPPYLHDGSAPDLFAVFERTRGKMGQTEHLSEEDLEALVAYLLTL